MGSNAVVACAWGAGRDGLPAGIEEALTLGRKASAAFGADLRVLALGPMAERLAAVAGQYGVRGIDHVSGPKVSEFRPDAFVEALAQYSAAQGPRLLLFSQTFEARALCPRVAGRLGAPVVMNAVGLEAGDGGQPRVTAAAFGGDTRVVYELAGAPPFVVAVSPNAVTPAPAEGAAGSPAIVEVAVNLDAVEERVRIVSRARTEGPRLEDAEIIVAGGRGLGEQKNFKLIEELAEAVGGMAAASRPLVDEGWIDASRQIGLTGKITRPVLYVAAGISGASQHMAGCAAAKTIVAINSNDLAPIFRYARYGVVGNCIEILPEITRAAKEARKG